MRAFPVLALLSPSLSAPIYQINFAPAPNPSGFRNSTLSSWGGAVVESEGAFHLFASAFLNNCTLSSWGSNSVAIHAVGSSPLGPFVFVERALPYYHHNVAPIIAPDGTFLIFAIGMSPDPTPGDCSHAQETPPAPLTHGFESIECWSAPTVHGPWTAVAGNVNTRNLFNGTNPAPAFDPSGNGTVFVMSHTSTALVVSVASSWRGPYAAPVPVATIAVGDYVGEDPFLWFDASIQNDEGGVGAWRVLYHAYNKSDSAHQFQVGGYAQSAGHDIFGAWSVQDPAVTPAYTVNFTTYDAGAAGPTTTTTLSRRERPKLWRDPATGAPAVLFTGSCPPHSTDCFTSAAPILAADG
jgi:hypothetical protein